MTLVDDSPEVTQKIIQISGTPEQTERAQSLLQGFILSSEYLFSLNACCMRLLSIIVYLWFPIIRLLNLIFHSSAQEDDP